MKKILALYNNFLKILFRFCERQNLRYFGGLESRELKKDSSFCESKKKQKLLKESVRSTRKLARFVVQKIGFKVAVVQPPIFC